MFCKDYRPGQDAAHKEDLIEACLTQASFPNTDHPNLRQWSCLCLSMLWKDHNEAKWSAIRRQAHIRLCNSAWDPVPEVRAAMLHALTNLIGIETLTPQVAKIEEAMAFRVINMSNDGSSLVRRELVIYFSAFVRRYQNKFTVVAYERFASGDTPMLEQENSTPSTTPTSSASETDNELQVEETCFSVIWKMLLVLSADPDFEVCRDAQIIIDYVFKALIESPLGHHARPFIRKIIQSRDEALLLRSESQDHRRSLSSFAHTPAAPQAEKPSGYFSLGMRRTASVAASLRNLAFGFSEPSDPGRMTINSGRSASTLSQMHSSESISLASQVDDSKSKHGNAYQASGIPKASKRKDRTPEEKKSLRLRSNFLDWSSEYFREPQMKSNEADEPGSEEYNSRLWRRNRNEKILEETQKLKEHAGSSRWDNISDVFNCGIQPMKMCFHQYDNHLAVSDARDNVR